MKLLVYLVLFAAACTAADAELPAKVHPAKLMEFVDDAGAIQLVSSRREWKRRRAQIVQAMEAVMGPLPSPEKRTALEVRMDEEVDCGDHVRRLMSYDSEPGSRVPAYLLIPKSALQTPATVAPAVLCLHPTNEQLGPKTVVGLGPDPGRAYALELVQRGFVTLAPAYPHLGNYAPDLKKLGYASGTMKAIWDNIRGLDLLESLPFVKGGGFGVIGHSLGGHNAIFTAVFDSRIRVVVSSCGFDSFADYYRGDPKVWQAGKGWTQERYMPRLAAYAGRLEEIPFDFHEVIAALAPRPVFVSAPMHDANFTWRSVEKIGGAARPAFELYGLGDQLEIVHPNCGHEFPNEIRERAYRLFEEQLRQ